MDCLSFHGCRDTGSSRDRGGSGDAEAPWRRPSPERGLEGTRCFAQAVGREVHKQSLTWGNEVGHRRGDPEAIHYVGGAEVIHLVVEDDAIHRGTEVGAEAAEWGERKGVHTAAALCTQLSCHPFLEMPKLRGHRGPTASAQSPGITSPLPRRSCQRILHPSLAKRGWCKNRIDWHTKAWGT